MARAASVAARAADCCRNVRRFMAGPPPILYAGASDEARSASAVASPDEFAPRLSETASAARSCVSSLLQPLAQLDRLAFALELGGEFFFRGQVQLGSARRRPACCPRARCSARRPRP